MNLPGERGPDHPSQNAGDTPADRRRIDEIFGDVLPDITRDERDTDRSAGGDDGWYLDNRPPHHG